MAHLLGLFLLFLAAPLPRWQVSATSKTCIIQGTQNESAKQTPAKLDTPISIQVVFPTPSTDNAARALLYISDPDSPNYGHHWTAHQVAQAFASDQEHIETVVSWLNSSGLHLSRLAHAHGKGYLHFNTTVRKAAGLFNTTFRHALNGQLSCDVFKLPERVTSAVEYVVAVSLNFTSSSLPAKEVKQRQRIWRRQTPKVDKNSISATIVNCTKYMAPSCLRELYGIPSGNVPHPNNSFGIYEISWDTWLPADLDMFFGMFQPDMVGQRPVIEPINGGYLQTDIQISPFNIEADVDFEYAMAITSPQPVIDLQVGDRYQQGTINNMLAAFDSFYCGSLDSSLDSTSYPDPRPGGYNHTVDCGTLKPPKVISISYGYPESSFPPEYLHRQCLEFLKLGLMGVTVITGSGDHGPASAGTTPCLSPTTNSSGPVSHFNPVWPASCPWVTSVGGTQRSMDPNHVETAFNTILGNTTTSSGGGFSNTFHAPTYQIPSVSSYLTTESAHLCPMLAAGTFSPSGRGTPDVSAFASSYLAVVDGTLHTVYGTSASAPVFASIISLINGERLRAGKGTVGFINPVLYKHPDVLNDVTTGANSGCGVDEAFRATDGWDAVTGLGSPSYERMRDLFMRLP